MDNTGKSMPGEPIFGNQPQRPQTIVIQQASPVRVWLTRILVMLLLVSLFMNAGFLASQVSSLAGRPIPETYHSGDQVAKDKIAVITVSGTIMPPFTKKYLKAIKQAEETDAVKGVMLVVDSPGGLVADSHQIYHRLKELSEKKPVYVAMQRMAASGGYYIAMGAGTQGKIYAEPTTWTGSIGVIIPRYDVSKLAEKWDIKVEPLTTGPFKDALSPFRELTEPERAVWKEIMDDAFQRFVTVIDENRQQLDEAGVKKLATGQVYTANQALANGLVDKIGFLEDAIEDLKGQLGLETVRVVSYQLEPTLSELFLGGEASETDIRLQALMDSTVPRAMYFCSWGLGVPGW
ncbi:MAG: signal peptide peptidase SppA [Planctomycetaceae bacterium]